MSTNPAFPAASPAAMPFSPPPGGLATPAQSPVTQQQQRHNHYHAELDPNEIAHEGDYALHVYVKPEDSPVAAGRLYPTIPAHGIIHPIRVRRRFWEDLRPAWYAVWGGTEIGVTHSYDAAITATRGVPGQAFKHYSHQKDAISRFQMEYEKGNVKVLTRGVVKKPKTMLVIHSTLGNAIACALSAMIGALLYSIFIAHKE